MRLLLSAPRIGAQIAFAIAFAWGCFMLWPDKVHAQWWQYALSGLCGYISLIMAGRAFLQIVHYHHQETLDIRSKHPPVSYRGARFATERDVRAKGMFDPNNGIPIGQFNGRPIFYKFTHGLSLAPAGTGKTVSLALPALAHGYRNRKHRFPSGSFSVICIDLKRELLPMTKRLRGHPRGHGHRVIIIDPSDPESNSYNSLDLVRDALEGRANINKALTRAQGLAFKLEPEPLNEDKNTFFREGSRKIITLVILYICLKTPDKANLTEVRRLVLDTMALIDMLEEATKMDDLSGEIALMAKDILSIDKHFGEFRSGASMALEPYSPAGELAHVVSHSDFRASELKTVPTTVYICVSLAEQKQFKRFLAVLTESFMTEISESPHNIPVHFLLDEATNFAFDISEKLTALRGVGARVQIIAQEYEEILRVFGKHAGPTIFNECDLKQFFGVSDLNLAKKLSEMIGEKLVVKHHYNLGKSPWEDINQSSNYERRPLMTPQEIMNMKPDEQLIFANGLVIRCHKLRYDEVHPWLSWLDNNPLEGGKLPGPPHIRIAYSRHGAKVVSCRKRRYDRNPRNAVPKRPFLPLWAVFAGIWSGALYFVWQVVM